MDENEASAFASAAAMSGRAPIGLGAPVAPGAPLALELLFRVWAGVYTAPAVLGRTPSVAGSPFIRRHIRPPLWGTMRQFGEKAVKALLPDVLTA